MEQIGENSFVQHDSPQISVEGGVFIPYTFGTDGSVAIIGQMAINSKNEVVAFYPSRDRDGLEMYVYNAVCGWVPGDITNPTPFLILFS